MRYVFIDEAGTSANEPVSVVVGLIVHADTQCVSAEKAVDDILGRIPKHLRKLCPIFHAKKIWGDERLRENWSPEERKTLLQAMMSIPRDLNLALAVGACRRTMAVPERFLQNANVPGVRPLSIAQIHHATAFQECCAKADLWIRKYANPDEVATVIAEDVPESKKLLRHAAKWLKTVGEVVPTENVQIFSPPGMTPLVNIDEFRTRRISKIRMPIHFVEKQDEPLLQIADACAFGFRRFLSQQNHGGDFINAIVGSPQDVRTFEIGNPSGGIFSWSDKSNISYSFGPWRG